MFETFPFKTFIGFLAHPIPRFIALLLYLRIGIFGLLILQETSFIHDSIAVSPYTLFRMMNGEESADSSTEISEAALWIALILVFVMILIMALVVGYLLRKRKSVESQREQAEIMQMNEIPVEKSHVSRLTSQSVTYSVTGDLAANRFSISATERAEGAVMEGGTTSRPRKSTSVSQ